MRLEHGAARRLGRMGGEDELDPEPRAGRLQRRLVDAGAVELGERIGQRLARHPPLGLVLAAAADAVMLLGDVGELEEQRERAQDGPLPIEPEGRDRLAERAPRASGARVAGKGADPLLVVEEILALLLDEHAPEQVAEQAHVGAESGVGGHRLSLEQGRP